MHDSTSSTLLTLPPKQPYRINNCKFQNSMISFLSELHTTKAYTDVCLHAEGKLLNAHKIVLAAGSSYFNNLFKSLQPSPSSNNHHQCPANLVIALPNVKYKDLERVVKFIYLGYLDIINSELEGFVDLAKQLGVVGMSDDEEENEDQVKQGDEEDEETEFQDNSIPPTEFLHPLNANDELEYNEVVNEAHDLLDKDAALELPGSPPSSLPNEFLQVNYTDEEEELTGYPLDDDMDEDEENSGDYSMNPGTSGGNSRLYGNTAQEKPFVCTKCGKTYNSNKSLWRHKKFTCDEKIEFKCSICAKIFSRSDNLRRHVVVAHS